MKNDLWKVKDGKKTLIFRPFGKTRSDGATDELVGYTKGRKTFWY